ncbi:MAG: HAD family phosphatase [Acidimicrobiales bacterium]
MTGEPLPLPEAVLWDLDGTLVDTEPAWIVAEAELASMHGAAWTHEDAEALVGSALPHAAAVLRSNGVEATDDEIIEFLLERVTDSMGDTVPWQPGAIDLLTSLHAAGVPCALVTMSYRELADVILADAPDGVFVLSVTGDEVVHGKPDPEPYLRAAALLGVDVTRCVAMEDSPTGLASAEAAGARVIGVQHVVPVTAAPGRSRLRSLLDIGVDDFRRVLAGEVIDELA